MKPIAFGSLVLEVIASQSGGAPAEILLFKEGMVEVEGFGTCMVDRAAFDIVAGYLKQRGVDVVIDYEHQSLKDMKAPAAGWIKELRYEDGVGIMARVDWTAEAAAYVAKKEYRYFSPTFLVRNADRRVIALHSVALTNTPRTNHLTPILAKLELDKTKEEADMEFFKKLLESLKLQAGATADDVLSAVAKLSVKDQATREVLPGEIVAALDLKAGDDVSTVVASIHALKQVPKGMVSKADFDALQKKILQKEAEEVVAKAMAAGKITPDQKTWAVEYAEGNLKGFETFVAKAPVVIPMDKLPVETDIPGENLDEATLAVAKLMGVSEDSLKKYAAK